MSRPGIDDNAEAEIARLAAELASAQAYEQRLRQLVVDVHDTLARGHASQALSMLNEALRIIDDQADVVAPHDPRRPADG
jgi:primosomal protein N''